MSSFMCIYIYACRRIYIYIYIYVCVCECVCVCVCASLRLPVFLHLHVVTFVFSCQHRDAGLGGVGGKILVFLWQWKSPRKCFAFSLVAPWWYLCICVS